MTLDLGLWVPHRRFINSLKPDVTFCMCVHLTMFLRRGTPAFNQSLREGPWSLKVKKHWGGKITHEALSFWQWQWLRFLAMSYFHLYVISFPSFSFSLSLLDKTTYSVQNNEVQSEDMRAGWGIFQRGLAGLRSTESARERRKKTTWVERHGWDGLGWPYNGISSSHARRGISPLIV